MPFDFLHLPRHLQIQHNGWASPYVSADIFAEEENLALHYYPEDHTNTVKSLTNKS